MRISVALCTYNGERFIREQLDSIAGQSRPPDEIVISDDGSEDGTPEIAEAFAVAAPFDVAVARNERRLGTAGNFEQAALSCTGDLVAFSDQDDVWMPGKLSMLEDRFRSEPEAAAILTDAEVVDERLRSLGYGMWDSIGFAPAERIRFEGLGAVRVLLRMNVATGATMAVRRDFLDSTFPVPAGWMHDGWTALAAAVQDRLRLVDARLIRYRQHPGAQIGSGRRGARRRAADARNRTREYYADEMRRFETARERFSGHVEGTAVPGVERLIEEKIAHMRVRSGLSGPGPLRLAAVIGELLSGRYHRYSNGLRSCWKDIVF